MNSPRIDFGALLKETVDANTAIYQAAHAEGYKLGYAHALTEVLKIIEQKIGPVPS